MDHVVLLLLLNVVVAIPGWCARGGKKAGLLFWTADFRSLMSTLCTPPTINLACKPQAPALSLDSWLASHPCSNAVSAVFGAVQKAATQMVVVALLASS